MEALAVVTMKIHQGQRSWPTWMEAAPALAVGEEELCPPLVLVMVPN